MSTEFHSPRSNRPSLPGLLSKVVLALVLAGLAGCKSAGIRDQRLVSKPNMTFSEAAAFSYEYKLLSQLESGSAASGGARSSGCSSCR